MCLYNLNPEPLRDTKSANKQHHHILGAIEGVQSLWKQHEGTKLSMFSVGVAKYVNGSWKVRPVNKESKLGKQVTEYCHEEELQDEIDIELERVEKLKQATEADIADYEYEEEVARKVNEIPYMSPSDEEMEHKIQKKRHRQEMKKLIDARFNEAMKRQKINQLGICVSEGECDSKESKPCDEGTKSCNEEDERCNEEDEDSIDGGRELTQQELEAFYKESERRWGV